MAIAGGSMKSFVAGLLLLAWLRFPSTVAFSKRSYCRGWDFSVEADNLLPWKVVPGECEAFVADYVFYSGQYLVDSQVAAESALPYARTLNLSKDGKDAWIFDIDETSLSNVPYYALHSFGAEAYDNDQFTSWIEQAAAPALPATLTLYKELKKLGFKVFFLTGRDEDQRNCTVKNLRNAGYSGWRKLILRQSADKGVAAVVYKSGKRKELEEKGFHIVGNMGDRWSDLKGYSVGNRVFKLPNPMYYIPYLQTCFFSCSTVNKGKSHIMYA